MAATLSHLQCHKPGSRATDPSIGPNPAPVPATQRRRCRRWRWVRKLGQGACTVGSGCRSNHVWGINREIAAFPLQLVALGGLADKRRRVAPGKGSRDPGQAMREGAAGQHGP